MMKLKLTKVLVHRLPKTDLHVHLDGSVRPATIRDLAK
jgi:adenosine deaminase